MRLTIWRFASFVVLAAPLFWVAGNAVGTSNTSHQILGSSSAQARVLPAPPQECDAVMVASGADLSGCILWGVSKPSKAGWGTPPFPVAGGTTADGWVWNGWGYNNSPALNVWESNLVFNTKSFGGVHPGALRSPSGIMPLFEGFLAEISANGYKVREAGTYSFRCMSTTTRSCFKQTPSALSFHSWGAAMDMNSATNPETVYSSAQTGSACTASVTTDISDAVISSAQRWGLIWGGYGWTKQCQTPGAQLASLRRDPHHFEFRGTPEQAAAIVAHNAGNAVPAKGDATLPTVLVPSTSAPSTTSRIVLKRPFSGVEVKELQHLLAARGYPTFVDGVFGRATEKSVRALQKAAGLAITGVVTQDVWDFLATLPPVSTPPTVAVDVPPLNAPASAAPFAIDALTKSVLFRSRTGDEVIVLTTILHNLGFDVPISDTFGPRTDRAVRSFQTKSHLTADGVVAKRTWAALLSAVSSAPAQTSAPAETPIAVPVRVIDEPAPVLLTPPGAGSEAESVLYRGKTGPDVVTLTKLLNNLGFDVPISDTFGPITEMAVREFQRCNRLVVDGVVGKQTWAAFMVFQ